MPDPEILEIPPETLDYIEALQDGSLDNPILTIDGQGAINVPTVVKWCLRAINQYCAGSSITVTQSNNVVTKIELSNTKMSAGDNDSLRTKLDAAIAGYDGGETYGA